MPATTSTTRSTPWYSIARCKTRVLFDSTAKPGAIVHDVGILLG